MELKIGDKVKVEGKESTIETQWNQGRHRVTKLKDGRQFLDLAVETKVEPSKGRQWDWLPKDGEHDFEE